MPVLGPKNVYIVFQDGSKLVLICSVGEACHEFPGSVFPRQLSVVMDCSFRGVFSLHAGRLPGYPPPGDNVRFW